MKMKIPVTRSVNQTIEIEVEVPIDDLMGLTKSDVAAKFSEAAEELAESVDYSGEDEDAKFESTIPEMPDNIAWIDENKSSRYAVRTFGGLT